MTERGRLALVLLGARKKGTDTSTLRSACVSPFVSLSGEREGTLGTPRKRGQSSVAGRRTTSPGAPRHPLQKGDFGWGRMHGNEALVRILVFAAAAYYYWLSYIKDFM